MAICFPDASEGLRVADQYKDQRVFVAYLDLKQQSYMEVLKM
jgi:hypothetical protein